MGTLKDIMRETGRRQKDLADTLEVSEPTVSRWASGAADIPSRYIQPIADFLGVPALTVLEVATRETAG